MSVAPIQAGRSADLRLSARLYERLSRLVAGGKRAAALAYLEKAIGEVLPLFAADPVIFGARRTAWLVRTQLLLEWGRPAEALAWTCLECQLAPSPDAAGEASALRDRLLRQLRLEFPTEPGPTVAAESQWPGMAGMFDLRAVLERDLITPLRYPEDARRYRVLPPNGILLYGPPGCGKTFIARKIAEKLGWSFTEFKPGDLGSIYIHGAQEKIAKAFEEAEQQAPVVLFFDEIDALGARRDAASHDGYAEEVNTLLAQLDGCAAKGILVVGATNFPGKLDPALVRAGRLEQRYFVGPPDFAARFALFRHHLAGRPAGGIDLGRMAARSEGYTAADITYLCEQAARLALSESKRAGREVLIAPAHIDAAMRAHPPTAVLDSHTAIGFRP